MCASRPKTGLIASAENPNGILEKFIEGNLPKAELYEAPNADKPIFCSHIMPKKYLAEN